MPFSKIHIGIRACVLTKVVNIDLIIYILYMCMYIGRSSFMCESLQETNESRSRLDDPQKSFGVLAIT